MTDFVGLEDPPVLHSSVPGHTFRLTAPRIGSLNPGSPIFFRDLTVGEVLGWDVGRNGERRHHPRLRARAVRSLRARQKRCSGMHPARRSNSAATACGCSLNRCAPWCSAASRSKRRTRPWPRRSRMAITSFRAVRGPRRGGNRELRPQVAVHQLLQGHGRRPERGLGGHDAWPADRRRDGCDAQLRSGGRRGEGGGPL